MSNINNTNLLNTHEFMAKPEHQKSQNPCNTVMDIFQVEDGKLLKHWDVMQPVPPQEENKNTMF
jgi:predicted SnoaL-like aldol condensation-catalyzing enzyme